MSVISEFYDNTGTVIRNTTATPTSTDTLTTITATLIGALFTVDEKSKLFNENNLGREFDYVTDSGQGILRNDTLYLSTVQYDVLGVGEYVDREDDSESYTNLRVLRR